MRGRNEVETNFAGRLARASPIKPLLSEHSTSTTTMTSSQGVTQSPALPHSFIAKKHRILEALAVPVSEYDDLSPKGSIDVGIRDLIDEINSLEGCVTTSSCAGRVSVFLEGSKTASEGEEEEGEEARTVAGVGGKGGGGEWLFVSHDPIPTREDGRPLDNLSWCKAFAMEKPSDLKIELAGNRRDISKKRFVHFKFEPMVCSSTPPPCLC